MNPTRSQKQSVRALWKLVNQQESVWNQLYPKIMKTTSHANDTIRWVIIILVQKFIPMLQAMKIPDAKASVEKEWKNLQTISSLQLDKVKSKSDVILEAQRDKKKVYFATLMDIFHLKNAKLEPIWQKIQRQSRAPWWRSKWRLWSLRSFFSTGLVCVTNDGRKSNGRHCKTTRIPGYRVFLHFFIMGILSLFQSTVFLFQVFFLLFWGIPCLICVVFWCISGTFVFWLPEECQGGTRWTIPGTAFQGTWRLLGWILFFDPGVMRFLVVPECILCSVHMY